MILRYKPKIGEKLNCLGYPVDAVCVSVDGEESGMAVFVSSKGKNTIPWKRDACHILGNSVCATVATTSSMLDSVRERRRRMLDSRKPKSRAGSGTV